MYSHRQELFYKFVSKITNKLVKQLLSMTVDFLKQLFMGSEFSYFGKARHNLLILSSNEPPP